MSILNHQIFYQGKAQHSLVALATKSSMQRRIGKKDGIQNA